MIENIFKNKNKDNNTKDDYAFDYSHLTDEEFDLDDLTDEEVKTQAKPKNKKVNTFTNNNKPKPNKPISFDIFAKNKKVITNTFLLVSGIAFMYLAFPAILKFLPQEVKIEFSITQEKEILTIQESLNKAKTKVLGIKTELELANSETTKMQAKADCFNDLSLGTNKEQKITFEDCSKVEVYKTIKNK